VAPSYPLRFFRVVAPVPGLVGWTFLVVAIIDAIAITSDPAKAPGAIVPVLLMQLFAASSGFAVPARRGHYDLLLTGGYSRVWMAVVHWSTSIAPGIVTWLAIAGVELTVTAGAQISLLTFGTSAAMGLVSTLPWALTVRLPRFSGGIGWLLVLASSTTVFPSVQMISGPHPLSDLEGMAWAAWSFLVYPPSLVGQALSASGALIAMPALVVAGCAMATACRWILRASVPLEAAQ
jgi:hypothetical protein